jgi:raffinose/stachyose/melibiose transport system permease protein/N-acetylglucosamine transport system permease protein
MSLKTSLEYFTSGALDFAVEPQWSNYLRVFETLKVKDSNFLIMFFNSIWQTFGTNAAGIFASCVVAYCLSKYKFGARNFMYAVIIFIMVYPSMGTGGASYKQTQDLKIFDTPFMIIKSLGGYSGMGFFVLYSFFATLPWDYADAAFIDGANDYQIFFKVMLPMLVPSAIALFVMSFISAWNNYEITLLYMKEYPNLAYGVYVFEEIGIRSTGKPVYFAGVLISLIPILALFLTFQNTIMEKVYLGGLKG